MTENISLRAADEERNAVPKNASALSDGNDASLEEGDNCQQESRGRRRERKLVGYSRFMAVVPSIGLFVSSIALTIATLISTVVVTFEAATGHLSMQDMLVEYIEYADFYLLAVVLYIMSVGLYSLFIDDGIDMPSWLKIHNLDDLKEKLVGVIVVVMGVYFLGLLIHGAQPVDLLLKGLGICAVIFALAYFVRHVMFAHKK